MAWIESHQELARHPKTRKLARALDISIAAAIGHLHLLWWWALDYAQDGSLARYDASDIAQAVLWDGDPQAFVDAMLEVRFLDRIGHDSLAIHDWDDYAGRLIDKRRQNAERMRNVRARAPHVQNTCGATVPYRTVPNSTVPKIGSSDLPPTPLEGATATTTTTTFGKEPAGDEKDLRIAIDFWQHNQGNLGNISAHELSVLRDYHAKGLDGPCLVEGMKRAIENRAFKMSYLRRIYDDWLKGGVRHLEDIAAAENDKRYAREKSKSGRKEGGILVPMSEEDQRKSAEITRQLAERLDLNRAVKK